MHILTNKFLPRRTFLQGAGASIALPFMDAMVPVRSSRAQRERPTRLICIEIVHGAAGSNAWGATQHLWAPAAVGHEFDLTPSALLPLDPYRKHLNIFSNTDVRMAEAHSPKEIGGDHFRSSAVFLTQSHPKQTEGSDVHVGTSLDQLYAQRFGQETPIPSMQLCIENINQSGGCAYGYTCIYTDSISWASPTEPLPVIRDPRVAFEQLFGAGATAKERAARRDTDKSILDWVHGRVRTIKKQLGPEDQKRLDRYLENVREIERRIQKIEKRNTGSERELPEAPKGVPDSFEEHVKLMFDLQVLAFASDITRVFSFKLGRDSSARVFPDSGSNRPFHPASHHGGRERSVTEFNKINKYHVGMLPYLLDKLAGVEDGESDLLENSMILYGSPMGDSNLHNHRKCPLIVLGGGSARKSARLPGNTHFKAADDTPMANVMLSLLHRLGLEDLKEFGDSTRPFAI